MIVFREVEQRRGVRICHLFRDCPVLRGKRYETVETPRDREVSIATCNTCREANPATWE